MSTLNESLLQKFAGFWKTLNLTQKLLLKSVPVFLIVVIGVSASMAYRAGTDKKINPISIQNDSPAPLSEKTYTEDTSYSSISGPPGVDSNVQAQDTGIGSQTTVSNTISETIQNDSPVLLSEKTYEEVNTSPSIQGPPGVESNVWAQDTGIRSKTTVNRTISESREGGGS